MGIKNSEELRSAIVQAAALIDFKELGRDVQPFLFNPSDAKKWSDLPNLSLKPNWKRNNRRILGQRHFRYYGGKMNY